MFNSSGSVFTMPVVPQGSGYGSGFGGEGGWFIWVILILAIFGGWGNGGWGGYGYGGGQSTSVYEGYVLNNDMSILNKAITDQGMVMDRKFEGISNGICSLGYDQLAQMNNISTNIMTTGNAIQTQLAQCCCDNKSAIADVKYAIGTNTAVIDRSIADGFCQTNFNAVTNTRDIVDSQNANTRAILDKLAQMEVSAKDEKIAELTAKNADLRLAASQAAQNTYLIDKLGYHMPVAAYQVPNPFCNCNCNSGCGC